MFVVFKRKLLFLSRVEYGAHWKEMTNGQLQKVAGQTTFVLDAQEDLYCSGRWLKFSSKIQLICTFSIFQIIVYVNKTCLH